VIAIFKPARAVLLTVATLVLGLALTAAGLWWQNNSLQQQDQVRFALGAQRTETEVLRRLNQALLGLKAVRNAIAAHPQLSRQEFSDYVQARDMQTEFPGIRGFGFVERVLRPDLPGFVARQRAQGMADFVLRSSGSLADLYVVRFIEPFEQNRVAWGLDMGQERRRRAALEATIESGQPILSEHIELVQDSQQSPSFLYFLPVFKKGSNPQNALERQRDLFGVVYAPLVASELLGSVYQASDKLVDFELYDGSEAEPSSLVFDADGVVSIDHSVRHGHHKTQRQFALDKPLLVGGHVLTLRMSSSATFESASDRSSLAIVGAAGTLVSVLMALSVWLLALSRQRAEDLAAGMTAELKRMAQVVQHTDNAVTITGRDLRIQWVNQGFTRITGYSFEEALGRTPGELLGSGKSDPQALQALMDAAACAQACRVVLINRAKDGHEYWADTEVQPTFDASGALCGFMEIGTDISRQQQIQLQLEAAIRDARALRDTVDTHAIVSVTDAKGNITDVNDAFCCISGYTRDELIGQNHRLLNSGQESKAFWAELWQTIGSGKPWHGEICNRAKDGSLYWVSSMIAPFVGENGQIEKYVSIRTDVTAQHQSAERLRHSELTFSASFQDAASGIGFLSPKGQWLRANPALCDFLGYSEAELHELTLHDTNHPDEWDTDQLQLQRLLDGEIAVYQRAKRYVHRDGHVLWGLASISVVRSAEGVPEFVISQIVDITARKRAEEALTLSNALMEESQAIAKVGGWSLALTTGEVYWTEETYRILETSPEAFNPTLDSGLELYLPESRERLSAALQASKEWGIGYDLELQTLTAKGQLIDVRTTCTATLEQGRVLRLSGIFQDITERKQYERSLKDAREKAEQATQSKGQFLANMSHEIRTPMNAILGMLRLLQNTELTSRQLDYTEKTEGAAKSLLALINDILDFSKVEAGKMTLESQPFRLDRLMRNLAVILSSNLGSKGIDLLFDIEQNIPDVLLGDAMRLQQVLINLGGNAVKFTAQGEVVVSVRLLHADQHSAHLEFAVRDSGIGIAPENQAHIFTGFSQAEASTTRKFGGTGLGLSISQRLVALMGGELGLTSSLGQGSTFAFSLHLPLVHEVPAELRQEPVPHAAPRRALVVDNNPVARDLVARMARSWGWSAQVAEGGEAALQLLAQQLDSAEPAFDVIYMDWQMPGLDGWTTTAQLRQLFSARQLNQPLVVMLSSSSRETLEQRTHEEQSLLSGFLMKPVTASMLLDATLNAGSAGSGLRRSPRSKGPTAKRRLAGMRILVVEDNLINQQVAEELLLTEGALVSLAANGQLGVDAIAAGVSGQQFHAVLMDMQMPVLDGFGATRVVRETLQLHSLPIIAMTANALASDREDCLAAGMNEHVGKPFELNQLVYTLLRVTGFKPEVLAESDSTLHVAAQLPLPLAGDSAGIDVVGIDVSGALQRMGGLSSLYQRSAREFLHTLPAQVAELQSALHADLRQAGMLAHTLKGTAAMLGASALSQAASDLEKQCKAGSAPDTLHTSGLALARLADHSGTQLQAALALLAGTAAAPAMSQSTAPAPEAAPSQAKEHTELHQGLAELMQLLAADDVMALEKYAELAPTFYAVPDDLLAPLEEALQDLELGQGLQACEAISAWLETVSA
jgi:PAS domain S-box-containing protein